MNNQQEKIRMPRVEGRYMDTLGQWTGWMELQPHVRQHRWGMTKFEIRISPEECLHQWLLVRATVERDRALQQEQVAWCPNCNEMRVPIWTGGLPLSDREPPNRGY